MRLDLDKQDLFWVGNLVGVLSLVTVFAIVEPRRRAEHERQEKARLAATAAINNQAVQANRDIGKGQVIKPEWVRLAPIAFAKAVPKAVVGETAKDGRPAQDIPHQAASKTKDAELKERDLDSDGPVEVSRSHQDTMKSEDDTDAGSKINDEKDVPSIGVKTQNKLAANAQLFHQLSEVAGHTATCEIMKGSFISSSDINKRVETEPPPRRNAY